MDVHDWLAKRFEETRPHLKAVAYRMLGSSTEADDALQEAWLRLNRAPADVENTGGWLTTLVARVCLDMLRSRRSRREDFAGQQLPEALGEVSATNAEGELALADSIGPALMVVLQTLAPNERVAFVLHDTFGLTFDEIALIVGRTPEAARQLASRARRKVQGVEAPPSELARHREIVGAFLAASRDGNFEALVAVLAPDVVFRADEPAVRAAAANHWGGAKLPSEVRGARSVAETLKGRARGASAAFIDGEPGAVWAVGGQARAVFKFTVQGAQIAAIELMMAPASLARLDIELEERSARHEMQRLGGEGDGGA